MFLMIPLPPSSTRTDTLFPYTTLFRSIKELLDEVLDLTGYQNELSLNATYGGKYAEYIDIRNEVIDTPEQFVALYLQGFLRTLEGLGISARSGNRYYDAYAHVRKHKKVLKWLKLFLTRTYLRKYEIGRAHV